MTSKTLLAPRAGRGVTSAKVILIGEHSVVYGRPALAIPVPTLPMKATATPTAAPTRLVSDHYDGPLGEAPDRFGGVAAAVVATLARLGAPQQSFRIEVQTMIPLARGLGSSAAVSGAIVRALFDAYDAPLSDGERWELVQVAERVAHGSPSGLDALVTNATGLVRFERGTGIPLPMAMDAVLVIGDTGVPGHTKESVGAVRQAHTAAPQEIDPLLDTLEALTERVQQCLATGDAARVGGAFDEAHGVLSMLGVSSTELDRLVVAARAAGALGAKLTGGGRGGCMIALADDAEAGERVRRGLLKAGAATTWCVPLAEVGVA